MDGRRSAFRLILDDRKKRNCKDAKRPALRFSESPGQRGEYSLDVANTGEDVKNLSHAAWLLGFLIKQQSAL